MQRLYYIWYIVQSPVCTTNSRPHNSNDGWCCVAGMSYQGFPAINSFCCSDQLFHYLNYYYSSGWSVGQRLANIFFLMIYLECVLCQREKLYVSNLVQILLYIPNTAIPLWFNLLLSAKSIKDFNIFSSVELNWN